MYVYFKCAGVVAKDMALCYVGIRLGFPPRLQATQKFWVVLNFINKILGWYLYAGHITTSIPLLTYSSSSAAVYPNPVVK
jgi:hypothetical protein